MKTLLATLIAALIVLTAVPASASKPAKARGKGIKIGKHFDPNRAKKLKKWAAYEAQRKKKRTYKQYFSMKQEG